MRKGTRIGSTILDGIIKKVETDRQYADKLMSNFDIETRELKISDEEKQKLKSTIIRMYPGNDW